MRDHMRGLLEEFLFMTDDPNLKMHVIELYVSLSGVIHKHFNTLILSVFRTFEGRRNNLYIY